MKDNGSSHTVVVERVLASVAVPKKAVLRDSSRPVRGSLFVDDNVAAGEATFEVIQRSVRDDGDFDALVALISLTASRDDLRWVVCDLFPVGQDADVDHAAMDEFSMFYKAVFHSGGKVHYVFPSGVCTLTLHCVAGSEACRGTLGLLQWTSRIPTACSNVDNDDAVSNAQILVDRCVSLGADCSTAMALRMASLKGTSLPLDWLRSNPKAVFEWLHSIQNHNGEVETPLFSHVCSLAHEVNTNRYSRCCEGSIVATEVVTSASSSLLLLDETWGFVATSEEAENAQRRSSRMKDVLVASVIPNSGEARLLLVHIAQSSPSMERYCTVDGTMPSGRSIVDDTTGPRTVNRDWNALIDIARMFAGRQEGDDVSTCGRKVSLVVVNMFVETFALCYTPHIHVLHVAVGFGGAWENTAAVVGKFLSSVYTLLGSSA